MSANPFIANPIKVVVYDPVKGLNRRTFCFLGDVPKNVQVAASSYNGASHSQRLQFDKVLREFYGKDFKEKLGLDIRDYKRAFINFPTEISGGEQPPVVKGVADTELNGNATGGEEHREFSKSACDVYGDNTDANEQSHVDVIPVGGADDDVDLSDIEELLKEPAREDKSKPDAKARPRVTIAAVTAEDLRVDLEPGIEYVRDIHVYPEDKFNELKEKIYLASGIPAYRQHLFYFDRNHMYTTYNFYAEGMYNIDIRKLSAFRDNVLGIPIDKTVYDLRESVRVEALDMFRILFNSLLTTNTVYIVDLAQFTQRIHTQLMDVVNDTYQFELFYYGFIIKYWPQLTQECFYDYMINEPELQHKYPDLAKSKALLSSIYKMEKDIIDYNYRNMAKALKAAENTVSIAITQMTATIQTERTVLNIRNLFDKLRVTRCIPEIHAYFDYNNRRYLLRKRHIRNASDIQFPSGPIMKNGITIAISLRKQDQETFHAKTSVSTMENEQSRYMFLNIWPNGRYYIRTVWNEEDELGFDDILKLMKKFTDPIINGINNLGRFVFMSGRELPLINKHNINYQSLNICVFWKKIMLESTFKLIKTLWDPYMRAGVIGPRNVQQFDKFEFLFRKGMYNYDINAIERIITASNNIILNNYYAHLSNASIKQKWDQNYDGRIVRMSHRTTDVRFEVSGIRSQEFQLFYRYIVLFIHRALSNEQVRSALVSSRNYKDVKKLRKLREQDPELYNLKKHGSKKVYSILCQNKRQPLIYTDEEIKNLPEHEVKKLYKYWNFTLEKPAYYGCPNKRYPHLGFHVGVHPKHYCLPCCKKSQSAEESRKNRIIESCLTKHKFSEAEGKEVLASRHIMNYGKDIDLGRLSKMPGSAIKGLLYGTLSDEKQNYYLFGVAQQVPGMLNVGLLYSVAEALDIPMEDLIRKLIAQLQKSSSSNIFATLLNGTLIEYFANIGELIDTIRDLFLEHKLVSNEQQKFKQWSELFTELFHLLFKVSVFTFLDENGSGESIDLYVPDLIRAEILYVLRLMETEKTTKADGAKGASLVENIMAGQTYILMIKKQNRYYPIFVVNSEKYFKTQLVDIRSYKYDDPVIKLIYSMVRFENRTEQTQVDKRIDLSLIKEFTTKTREWRIVTKYINKRNLCYAVLLDRGTDDAHDRVYVPIDYSAYVSDGVPISFESFDRGADDVKLSSLMKLFEGVNKFITSNYRIGSGHELYSWKLLKPAVYLTLDSKPYAIVADGMNFYINKQDVDVGVKTREVKYDYSEINKLIMSRAQAVQDNRTKLIGASLYNNYLYQLFVIEFVNYLDRERNNPMRNEIKRLITETNFRKDFSEFRLAVRKLLKEFPADFSQLQHQLHAFYHVHFDKKQLLENIDASVYEFDRITINRLRKLPRPELLEELKTIAQTFTVQKEFDTTAINFPNIYLPCSDMHTHTGYCDKGKLILNKPLDEFVDILANDVMDDLKSKYMLANIWQDTTIDMFKFAQHPTEIITIYKLTE